MRHVTLVLALIGLACGDAAPPPAAAPREAPGHAASAPPAAASLAVTYFDPGIEQATKDAGAELALARSPLSLGDASREVSVTTCPEYLEHTAAGLTPVTDADGASTPEYAVCAPVALAVRARPASTSHFPHGALGDALLRSLDLGSFASSLSTAAEQGKARLSDVVGASVETTATTVDVEAADWVYSVAVLAAADYDGDGIEDLLATFTDDAKQGTYFVTTPLLLHRLEAEGVIRAELPRPTP